ncbi:MAG: ankyrin repeat domain-containing protein [Clostridiales bacterium]|nr:ankyrin repeat domain-containing protein [Clostridiales bacterium]
MGKRGAFIKASKTGDKEKVSKLINTRISVNTCDLMGTTVLMHACNNNNIEVVKILLEQGANVNMQNMRGITALHIACDKENIEIVKVLLSYGASVCLADDIAGNTALHWAVARNNIAIAEVLLGTGVNIDIPSKIGATSLHLACLTGNKKIVQFLIDKGANVDAVCGKKGLGLTPLHVACTYTDAFKKDKESIKVKVNDLDSTVLFHPVFSDEDDERREIVEILIKNGASIGIRNINNSKAIDLTHDEGIIKLIKDKEEFINEHFMGYFMYACKDGDIKAVEECIKKGIDVNLKNRFGCTALMYASGKGELSIVKMLLKEGAYINERNKYGETALFNASIKCHRDVAEILLECGAEVDLREVGKYSVLTYLCFLDYKDMVELFLENGADINSTSHSITDLISACAQNDKDVVKALLKYGADPNVVDDCGQTALHVASAKGYRNIVTQLLIGGAEVNKKDIFDRAPIDIAQKKGMYNIAKDLIDNGCEVTIQIVNWVLKSKNSDLIKALAKRKDMYRYVVRRLIADNNIELLHEVKQERRKNDNFKVCEQEVVKVSDINKLGMGRVL